MSDKTTDPLAEFDQADADYLEKRIGELHCHAVLHEGELCSKLNRARIGGMIEVLSRIGLEVVCDWDRCTKKVTIFSKGDFEFLQKVKRSDKAKKVVRPGSETQEQRAALQEMLRRCDRPTGRSFPAIRCSRPIRPLPRGFLSSVLKQVWTW